MLHFHRTAIYLTGSTKELLLSLKARSYYCFRDGLYEGLFLYLHLLGDELSETGLIQLREYEEKLCEIQF